MVRKIEATAYQEGKWWTIEIPELGAPAPSGSGATMMPVGQASTAAKVVEEARDLAAAWTDSSPDEFEVSVTFRLPEDVTAAQSTAAEKEAEGKAAISEAARLRREAVRTLLAANMSQVDTATVLGISRQRVQQLA